MILSGQSIRRMNLLNPCLEPGRRHGTSYGLGPAGYDLRLDLGSGAQEGDVRILEPGEFLLAATLEHFDMPTYLVGLVKDKSTMARQGLSVYNTVIEPGWHGFLTLELIHHGPEIILLKQCMGIAQVLFETTDEPVERPYEGKYQAQEAGPQAAR